MINPVVEALNSFLAIYSNLPFAISAFVNLSLLLFLIVCIIVHFNNIR